MPEPIGIRVASAVKCFCGGHDSSLFAPVENRPFGPTPQQVFLLAFRSLCFELYEKTGALRDVPTMRLLDAGRPLEEQIRLQDLVSGWEEELRMGLDGLRAQKLRYDAILRSQEFGSIGYVVIEFARTPDILCSSALLPEYDFAGGHLQNLLDPRELDAAYFSLIATERGGAFVLSWSEPAATSQALARSLLQLPEDALPQAVARLLFEHSENIYLSPAWWEALGPDVQDKLKNRFSHGIETDHNRACLVDDGVPIVDWEPIATLSSFEP